MIRTRLCNDLVVLVLMLVVSLGSVFSWRTVADTITGRAAAFALPGPNVNLKELIDFIMQALRQNDDAAGLGDLIEDLVAGITEGGTGTCPAVSVDPPLDNLNTVPQQITLIADYNGPAGSGCTNAAGTLWRGRLTLQGTDIGMSGFSLGAKMSLQAEDIVQINAAGDPPTPVLRGLASGTLALDLDMSGKAKLTLNAVSTSLVVGTTPITGGIAMLVTGVDLSGATSDVTMQVTFNDLMQGTSKTTGGITIVMPGLTLNGDTFDTLTLDVTFNDLIVDMSTILGGFTAVLAGPPPTHPTADTVTVDVTFHESGLVLDTSTFLGGFVAVLTGFSTIDQPGDTATVELSLKPVTVTTPVGTTTYEGGGTVIHTVVDAMTMQTAANMSITNFGPIVLTLQTTEDALGQTLITTVGAGAIGAYQVEIVDAVRFDPAVCESLPVSGRIRFTTSGQVSTVEFIPACDGSYLFNGVLSNVPTTL